MSSSTSASDRGTRGFAALAVGVCLLTTLAVIAIAEWAWNRYDLYRSISQFRYQIDLAERSADVVTAIAAGDSHTALGYHSARADRRTVAYAGESVRETRIKLEYLLERLPRLRVVLLQAQPHMFFPHRDLPARAAYIALPGGPTFHPLEGVLDQFQPCCRARVIPAALRAVLGRLAVEEPDVLANGYLRYSESAARGGMDLDTLAAKELESYGRLEFSESLVRDYEITIERLRARGITVVLAHYPLSRSYRTVMPSRVLADADSLFSGFAKRYRLARCGSWSALTGDENFLNADHLNSRAAALYAQTLDPCVDEAVPRRLR